MKKRRIVKLTVLALLLAALGGGTLFVTRSSELRSKTSELWKRALAWAGLQPRQQTSQQVYWCPMHPQIKRSEPSTCPICNMALVELEAGEPTDTYPGLTLTARHVQQAGVATEPVLKRGLYREIDTTGRLVVDERRLAKIASWVYGRARIHVLHVNFTGETVQKDERLTEIFAPDLIVAQQELLVSLRNSATPGNAGLIEAGRKKLLYQGLTAAQVHEVIETGTVLEYVPVYAPISGTVIARHVSEGQYVNEGSPLLDIADLSGLWLYVDIYEDELPLVSVDQPVEVTVRSLPGQSFEGKVAFIDPVVQPDTRTVRVRLNIGNRDGTLKPGMYARARIRRELSPRLAVPENAVLWSGQRTIVILKEGVGRYRPVEIRLGQKWLYPQASASSVAAALPFGGKATKYHEVLAALSEGDQVVTAGAFLLNAESQFQSVLVKLLPVQSAEMPRLPSGIEHLLAAYFELSDNLANDQLEPISQSAARLADAAERLAAEAKEQSETALVQPAEGVGRAAATLATTKAGDLDAARRDFAAVSRTIIDLIGGHPARTRLGTDFFLFECPMAGEFGFKLWLQPTEDMRNPYMGQRMLTCGIKKDTFEPRRRENRMEGANP